MASGADIAKAYVQIIPSAEGIKGRLTDIMGGEADNAGRSAGGRFASVFGKFAKVGVAAIGAAATGVAALTKAAVSSYADYEQLVGGVETLFSSLDGTVSASSEVLANAANAYKTAGLSANQYMETVTSFSAALVSSLEGDYSKAAKVSDMAITDMSDNANKMGTSMDAIQMAYQGFAKQNYTMLDNLKLGYGGTKAEMERLLADAEKISGVHYDINNLSDVYEAIHVVQTEMGITGTTAEEAAKTISGSTAMMKSALANLMTGIADDNADFDTLVNNFVESVGTMADNILPRVSVAIEGVGKLIEKLAPQIAKAIPPLVTKVLPSLLSAASSLVQSFVTAISANLPVIVESAVPLIMSLVEGLIENLPLLANAAIEIILALADGISTSLPELVPVIVDVVLQIVNSLIQNAPLLLQAALQIMIALAQGLIHAVPEIVKQAPQIISALVDAIIQAVPMLLDAAWEIVSELAKGVADNVGELAGKAWDLITGLVSGIGEFFQDLWDAGKDMVEWVKDGAQKIIDSASTWGSDLVANFIEGIFGKFPALESVGNQMAGIVKARIGFSEPELGPLSNFHTYAPDMMELFMKGIRDNKKMLIDTVDDAFNFQDMIVSPTLGFSANVAAKSEAAERGVSVYGGINITIDGRGKDASELARELQIELNRRIPAWA